MGKGSITGSRRFDPASNRGGAPDSGALTVIVPAFNEAEALPQLLDEIEQACTALDGEWEVLVVDDGSTDGTFEIVERLAAERPQVRAARLRRNFGKSETLGVGISLSSGAVLVTIDGDGQDDPSEIPRLLDELERGSDLVSGWKRSRMDPRRKRWPSRLFNWVTAKLSGLALHDFNCGLKAYRAECARSLEIYGELHRFVPVLATQQGWRVTEIPVNHRPREYGRSKFGSERFVRGLFDLITVLFIGRYQHRPLHLFGGLGAALITAGLISLGYLTALKIGGEAIGDRPLLLLGVLLIVVGIQLLTVGLLAQMLVAMRQESVRARPLKPRIERLVGFPSPPSSRSDHERSATELDSLPT